ncbi:MAG: DUF1178 family protein [Alphaproteobacteria bacterium]
MIVFDLKCDRGHVFEAWFRDSKTYEAQVKAAEIVCPVCGDTRVTKAPMAPQLARRTTGKAPDDKDGPAHEHATRVMCQMRALRDHVEKNFDNVGSCFPEEARKIHYGEAEKHDIYGEASGEEARALEDEGIEFGILPRLPRHDS